MFWGSILFPPWVQPGGSNISLLSSSLVSSCIFPSSSNLRRNCCTKAFGYQVFKYKRLWKHFYSNHYPVYIKHKWISCLDLHHVIYITCKSCKIYTYIFMYIFVTLIKIPDNSNLRKKELCLLQSLRVQTLWWRSHGSRSWGIRS